MRLVQLRVVDEGIHYASYFDRSGRVAELDPS
jgi:hypothetical protein